MRFMKCSYRARKKNMKTIKIILLIMLRRNLANSEVSGGYRPLTTGWQQLDVTGSNIKYNYVFYRTSFIFRDKKLLLADNHPTANSRLLLFI